MIAEQPAVRRTNTPSRLVVLDGLRLLAATMVVFYHYVGVPNARIGHQGTTKALAWGTSAANVFPARLHTLAGYGWTGVELFFLISGFVICMSGWGRRPADFFVSRVVRLVPAYWTAVVLTAVVLMVFPRISSGVQPSMILSNLTMVQSAYGVPNLDPAYWTLLVELMFYLLFGLVAFGGITYRRMVAFCVLWSVASIAAAHANSPMLRLVVDPPYSGYFVAGIAFFLIYKFGGNLLLWAIVVYSWLVSVNQPRPEPTWQLTLLLTSFFVIMALVALHKLDRIRWRWLTVAGALTYPLYLIHQDIGFTVFSYLRGRIPASLLVMLTYAAMLGLAWLIHRGVERPVAPLLRAKLSEAVSRVCASGGPVPALVGAGGMARPARPGATPGATPGTRSQNGSAGHPAGVGGQQGMNGRHGQGRSHRPADRPDLDAPSAPDGANGYAAAGSRTANGDGRWHDGAPPDG